MQGQDEVWRRIPNENQPSLSVPLFRKRKYTVLQAQAQVYHAWRHFFFFIILFYLNHTVKVTKRHIIRY